jgi:hypothetical protein
MARQIADARFNIWISIALYVTIANEKPQTGE